MLLRRVIEHVRDQNWTAVGPPGVAPAVSAMGMQAIRAHPDIHRTLTEWIGFSSLITGSLERQNDAARRALAMVDDELAGRR